METQSYLKVTDPKLLKAIRKDLNEDQERLERQIELFKEWLKCEPHLPKNIDDHLIFNFVRFTKCNLDKAKKKFEGYLAARIKWRKSYSDSVFDEKYFAASNVHRQFVIHPQLTPEGYRVCFFRIPPLEEFDFDQLMHYGITLIEVLLYQNVSSGTTIVCDFGHFSSQHIAKIKIKTYFTWLNIIYNVSPLRINRAIGFRIPQIAETLINMALKILNEKMTKRVAIFKDVKGIAKYLPPNIIPDEYGGSGGDLKEYADQLKDFLIGNDDFAKKIAALQLAGAVPSNRKTMYSFEEYEMEGSFRKLNID